MSKEPSDTNGSRDRAHEGDKSSHVDFFDPHGKDIGRRISPRAAPGTAPPKSNTAISDGHDIRDQGSATLNERSAGRSTQSIHQHAEELGEALYAKFMHILKKQAPEKLTEADINAMGQEFRAQLVTIEAVFVKAVEDYARGQVQPREEKSRTNHFQRLLIHNFEHRFANETDLPEQSEKLSRRMLPGFFNMLQLMLGERRLAQFEKNAKDVVSKLRDKNSGTVDWSEVYRSPDARKLCIQAEIEIARHFTEMEKRLNWMVAILNAHLIPADKRTHSHGWVMNTRNAELMLSALLRDLRAALSNQKARAKMEDKLGQQTVTLLHTIAQRFSLPT